MHLGDKNKASDRTSKTEDGLEFSWGEMMSLLNGSPCIFANTMLEHSKISLKRLIMLLTRFIIIPKWR